MAYYPQRYVVYGGWGEPIGIMSYGGQSYYSDEPPWLTPQDLAEGVYRKKRGTRRFRLLPVEDVSDEVYWQAEQNQRARVHRR